MTTARVEMNIRDGTVSVEAPVDAIERILERLEVFLPRLTEAARPAPEATSAEEGSTDASSADNPAAAVGAKPPANGSGKAKRAGKSRHESYNMVNLDLSKEQLAAFQGLYAEKNPQGQSQHVLTVMYWLLNHTPRTSLSKDEIFTGLRTVKERVPGRLTSVLSNLKIDGLIVAEGDRFRVHHTGEDFVERDLPAAAKK